MKKLILILALSFATISCGNGSGEKERFMNTYKQILVAREFVKDTALANRKVDKIMTDNGYSQQTFQQSFMELARDREGFVRMIDSIRAQVERESGKNKDLEGRE